jgi:copper chaperone NosL
MKKITKILVIVSSLAMITAFFTPIWDISLEAPQYPEGLGMQIWINKITGDLQTINGLNHYIGMKKIEPDSIKELSIMPYVLGFLILAGVLAGIAGKKKLFAAWVIIFVIAGIAGGVDFYMWEYDYGHNLDPTAAIIVPGMSYQPPLIGSKELLNFVAHSYPDTGGMIVIGAGLLGLGLLVYETKFNKTFKQVVKNEQVNAEDNISHHADNRVLVQH